MFDQLTKATEINRDKTMSIQKISLVRPMPQLRPPVSMSINASPATVLTYPNSIDEALRNSLTMPKSPTKSIDLYSRTPANAVQYRPLIIKAKKLKRKLF